MELCPQSFTSVYPNGSVAKLCLSKIRNENGECVDYIFDGETLIIIALYNNPYA